MKMKKRLLHSLLLPLLLTACEDAAPLPETDGAERTRLHIQLRNEAAQEDIQVFSFHTQSPRVIDSYRRMSSRYEGFETGTGERIVAVVLNGPDLSAVADFEALFHWHYTLVSGDDPATHPLCFGFGHQVIDRSTRLIPVEVTIQTGRITVLRIANRLDGRQDIESLQLFLANAAGDGLLGSDYLETAVPIHPDGVGVTPESPAWAAVTLGALTYGATLAGPYYLYSCPTPRDWEPWLVLAARISGRIWYYNIPLSPIEKGVSQQVSVTLRTLGADRPCVDNEPGSYDLLHSPVAWTLIHASENI